MHGQWHIDLSQKEYRFEMFQSLQSVLLVYTNIVISSSLSTLSATFGSQVTLHCDVFSNDNVTGVFWERSTANGNITLLNGLSGTSGSTPETPSLTILVASVLDSGLYTCNVISVNKTIQGTTIMLTVQGASPDVQIESTSISGIHGNSMTLHVSINATPLPYNLYWTQENQYGEIITINSRATGYEGGNVSVPSLTISNPKFSENGLYTCFARNDFGLGYSQKISLIVEGDVPLVSLDTLQYNVSFGSTISLNCTVTALPNQTRIYWQRNQNDVITTLTQETEGITGVKTGSPTLTMTFVTISDAGSYTCFAENSVGVGSSRSALLTVTGGRPSVKIGSAMYSTIYGTTVTLQCDVTGDPPSTIVYWEKKSKGGIWSTLTSGSLGIEGIKVKQPSLTITYPVNSDAGEYICFGVNELGSSSSLPTVLIVIGEKPLVIVNSEKHLARHGDTYTLHCTVEAIPGYDDVYWEHIKNGVIRKIVSQTTGTRGVTIFNPSLTIKYVTISDEGLYTCYAVNIVGVGSSQTVFLSVEAAIPFVTAVIPSYSVKEGDGVSLLCKISSKPEQTHVYWKKENNGDFSILKEGTTGIIGATIDHPSLIFPRVDRRDSGYYMCFATNAVGTGSSRAEFLEVKPLNEDTDEEEAFTDTNQISDNTPTRILATCSVLTGICVIITTIITCYKCIRKESTANNASVEETNQSSTDNAPDPVLWHKKLNLSSVKTPCFSDCIILENTLVFTDVKNDLLVFFDDETGNISELSLSYSPWSITHVVNRKVAVSFPYVRVIQLIDITTCTITDMNTSDQCWGVSYYDCILYCVSGPFLKMIDLQGHVKDSIKLPSKDICYITVDAERFFCTDGDILYCCGMQGSIFWKFEFQTQPRLHGVTVDGEGNVIVAAEWSSTVLSVSPDGSQCKVILSATNGIDAPRGIFVDKDKNRLLVCNCNEDVAFLFDVKEIHRVETTVKDDYIDRIFTCLKKCGKK